MRRPIELTIRMTTWVPDDFDEDQVQFYLEEKLCRMNLIDDLENAISADDKISVCNLCAHSSVKVLEPGTRAFVAGGDPKAEVERTPRTDEE